MKAFLTPQDIHRVWRSLIVKTGTILLVAASCLAPAHADQVSKIKAAGQLACGVMGADEPFSYYDLKQGVMAGYDVELCKAVANKLGVKINFIQLTTADRIPALLQDRVDILAATLTHNKEREAQIDFSLSTFLSQHKAVVRKDSGITDLQALNGKKVGIIKGATMEEHLRKLLPKSQIIAFDSGPQAFMALLSGQTAAYVDEEPTLINSMEQLRTSKKGLAVLPQPIGAEHLALGLKKNEPGMKKQVDDALRALEQSGEAEKLFMKWFGPESKTKMPKRSFKIETDQVQD